MNSKEPFLNPGESLSEIDMDATSSVDDFIKELEAKEKDLHITSDVTIEVEEPDFAPGTTPDFLPPEFPEIQSDKGGSAQAGRPVGLKTRVYELENEIIDLQRTIAMVRVERNEIQEKSDRRLKDFENYKYRMDRERRGSFIDQISNLASQMLPVLDNLDRALDSVGGSKTVSMEGFQQFYDGIALVNQQVNEIFAEMGVQPISTVGQIFDPNLHEAVAAEENPDLPVNSISQEMLRGFRIGNRIIRHSMVKVTTGPSRSAEPEPGAQLIASDEETSILDTTDGDVPANSADLPEAE